MNSDNGKSLIDMTDLSKIKTEVIFPTIATRNVEVCLTVVHLV